MVRKDRRRDRALGQIADNTDLDMTLIADSATLLLKIILSLSLDLSLSRSLSLFLSLSLCRPASIIVLDNMAAGQAVP